MTQAEVTQAARERLDAIVDEHLARLAALFKAQADVMLQHAEACARAAAATRPVVEGDRVVYNRKDVARLLSCSVSTVDTLVRRGDLKHTRRWSGGPKCFLWEHVREYEARLREPGEGYAKRDRK